MAQHGRPCCCFTPEAPLPAHQATAAAAAATAAAEPAAAAPAAAAGCADARKGGSALHASKRGHTLALTSILSLLDCLIGCGGLSAHATNLYCCLQSGKEINHVKYYGIYTSIVPRAPIPANCLLP